MTREGEALEATKRFEKSLYDSDVASLTRSDMGFAYMSGIKWADDNPKSPWISVEDDLPCNHEELITTNGRYEKNTIYVITIDKYGIIESNYMVLYDDGKWEWKYSLPAPCYWMLIPKLPKESEIDLTVY